jgi:hypothetical protein
MYIYTDIFLYNNFVVTIMPISGIGRKCVGSQNDKDPELWWYKHEDPAWDAYRVSYGRSPDPCGVLNQGLTPDTCDRRFHR